MQLVENMIVKEGNGKLYQRLYTLCGLSKNLYNAALYQVRQEFFNSGKYLSYIDLQKKFQDSEQVDYRALPAKTSQQTLRVLDQNFKSFFAANQDYKVNPGKYKGKPKIPHYLEKDGRFPVIYTNIAISKPWLRKGYVKLEKEDIKIKLRKGRVTSNNLNQVRIIPRHGYLAVEIVYTVPDVPKKPDNNRYAAIDLGVNNLATLTSNVPGHTPVAISGKKVKSINHQYSKRMAKAQSYLKDSEWKTSRRTGRINRERTNRVSDYFHKATRQIVNHLVSENINTLIVGNNKGWKQDTKLGKVNNQNFCLIPFYRFIQMLQYKCDLAGINMEITSEEYTSKCSFLDQEEIGKHDTYLGNRVKRGLFISSTGTQINADVNGSYNILRKCKPNAFANGVSGVVVHPRVIHDVESNF